MDIIKLLEDSDSLIVAPELNERLQEKVQNIFIMLAQSLDQRNDDDYRGAHPPTLTITSLFGDVARAWSVLQTFVT